MKKEIESLLINYLLRVLTSTDFYIVFQKDNIPTDLTDTGIESGISELSSSSRLVCCVHIRTNTLRKRKNLSSLPPAMG